MKTPLSTRDQRFLSLGEDWIANGGETLALVRYSRSAGLKDFVFLRSADGLRDLLKSLPPATSVILFRKPQLPLRGRVTDEFIDAALALVPEGREYLVLSLDASEHGRSLFRDGERHQELAEELDELRGERVAVGEYPEWLHDNEDVVEAITPDAEGTARRGIY